MASCFASETPSLPGRNDVDKDRLRLQLGAKTQTRLALAGGGRCVTRLTRILMFPFFSLSIMDQLPLHRGAFQNAQTPNNAVV
jgi:hypothetical protein